MSHNPRHEAVRAIASAAHPSDASARAQEGASLTELFGQNVFNDAAQKQRLPKTIYKALRRTIDRGDELEAGIADAIANAMKDWAVERGATHFTHWFQPMTGLTAEKHDSFLQPTADGRALLEFSGKELIKGEPDASSFPSGGIRVTFEARGYTAWDPTSPAFLRETASGITLTIPTAFCSWTGEALDLKTPLLRSAEALDKHARRMLALLGDEAKRVYPTLGIEQEYFLIDSRFFYLRPDLVSCGRTLLGARPPKGQELEDHYFGATPQRVMAFMNDAERELWKLGIPVKTRHNEVAPGQFEMAPIFEASPIAIDHNMLLMEILQVVADRHGLKCLLHEKPFAGVNGSGKHNNWSLSDDRGSNLLEPGHTPQENLKFMVFLTAILRGVDRHQDLLRASIAHAGNDHRLGANEAPPAIISVFLGTELESIVQALIQGSAPKGSSADKSLKLGVSTLPPLPRDSSDRNRTSPFAFTGNKFEFRAVGSSQSSAYPNIVLNTAMAESLEHMANEIEQRLGKDGKGDLRSAAQAVVRETLAAHQRVLFSGDNYSAEWEKEAKKRGLLNLKDTPSALAHFAAAKNVALFETHKVFTSRETLSRAHVLNLAYAHRVAVEAHCMHTMAATQILPAAQEHQRRLAQAIRWTREAAPKAELAADERALVAHSELIGRLREATAALDSRLHAAEDAHGGAPAALAAALRDQVVPAMREVRALADQIEATIEDGLWPLPKYQEMLFLK
jgi:glutamine synthetase